MNWMLLMRLAPVIMQAIQMLQMIQQNVSDKLKMQKTGQDTSKEDAAITSAAKKLATTGIDLLPLSVQQKASKDELQTLIAKLEPAAFAMVDVVHAIAPLLD